MSLPQSTVSIVFMPEPHSPAGSFWEKNRSIRTWDLSCLVCTRPDCLQTAGKRLCD